MLIDYVVQYCDSVYKQHVQDHPCDECNHPKQCGGECKDCLDEVHYTLDGGRVDYNCENLLYYYTCRYSYKYCSEIMYALEQVNLNSYPRYDILSLGCGATPDLMAFEQINQHAKKAIHYYGIDRNPLWEPIHNEIGRYAQENGIDAQCQRRDIFEIFLSDDVWPNFNILIIEYLLSHLYNTQQIGLIDRLYDGIINNVVAHRRGDSPFLVIISDIDSNKKGRNHFWPLEKKIEEAGFHCDAYARCFKEKLYLERARRHQSTTNRFVIPEQIKMDYKVAIKCESAQLIIEVR